jgi:hypothetical protein
LRLEFVIHSYCLKGARQEPLLPPVTLTPASSTLTVAELSPDRCRTDRRADRVFKKYLLTALPYTGQASRVVLDALDWSDLQASSVNT